MQSECRSHSLFNSYVGRTLIRDAGFCEDACEKNVERNSGGADSMGRLVSHGCGFEAIHPTQSKNMEFMEGGETGIDGVVLLSFNWADTYQQ